MGFLEIIDGVLFESMSWFSIEYWYAVDSYFGIIIGQLYYMETIRVVVFGEIMT